MTETRTFKVRLSTRTPDDAWGPGIYESFFYGTGIWINPDTYQQVGVDAPPGMWAVEVTVEVLEEDVEKLLTQLPTWTDYDSVEGV